MGLTLDRTYYLREKKAREPPNSAFSKTFTSVLFVIVSSFSRAISRKCANVPHRAPYMTMVKATRRERDWAQSTTMYTERISEVGQRVHIIPGSGDVTDVCPTLCVDVRDDTTVVLPVPVNDNIRADNCEACLQGQRFQVKYVDIIYVLSDTPAFILLPKNVSLGNL